MIYDEKHNELRVNAANLADIRQYRAVFGRRLFGDENKFVFAEKYTLEPLKKNTTGALNCRDIAGIESVRLQEIEYDWDGAFDHVETHKAEDVFKALQLRERAIEQDVHIRRAVFKIKLEGEKRLRTVAVKAGNKSGYNRGEEAMLIEEWLRARGFVVMQPAGDNEDTNAAVAIA